VVGLTSVSDILKANANGYFITDRTGTPHAKLGTGIMNPDDDNCKTATGNNLKNTFQTNNAKYMGFDIVGSKNSDPVDHGANWFDDDHLFGKHVATPDLNCKEENIDVFRHAD